MAWGWKGFAAAIVAACGLIAVPALAQAPGQTSQPQAAPQPITVPQTKAAPGDDRRPAPDLPYLLKADEVTFDESLGLVIARGSVEISQGSRILLADTVTYNQKTDVMTASGNVSLTEPTGEVVFAEYAEFTDELKTGMVESIRVLLTDNSRLAANGARRLAGVTTEMSRAVYSPCELCKSDPTRPPLWQLKAVRVTHDNVSKDIEYHDVTMEMFGLPVMYLPYFSHPDPTVKRRSGFLFPTYGSSTDLGAFVRVPYYWVIDESKDATFSPVYTTNQGFVWAGEYRQRLTDGEFEFSGSFTQPQNPPRGADTRGHIRGRGRYDIDETWRAGFNLERSSDDTYMRRYGFGGSSRTLRSDAYVEGFSGRNYANLTAMTFQGLRVTDDPGLTPLVMPMAEYSFRGEPDRYGGRLNFDGSILSLTRDEGTDSRRISTRTAWNMQQIASSGEVFGVTASLQADMYDASDVIDPLTGPQDDGFTGRLFPQVKLDYRYPFANRLGSTTQIIEPIAGLVVAPRGGNPDEIPNEDSQDIEFDDTNLFADNRFTGVDRVEGGQRVVYGLRGGVYGDGGGSTTAFLGQSYRLNDDSPFAPGTGLSDQLSDVVGRLTITPSNTFDLTYRFRANAEDLDSRRNEVRLTLGPPRLRLNLSYFFIKEDETNEEFGDREEIYARGFVGVTPHWAVFASTRNDLTDEGGFISAGGGLQYTDECFTFETSLTRRFTRDRDLQPTTTFLFQFIFKNLGEFQAG